MEGGAESIASAPLWTHLFTFSAYAMAAGCLYFGIQRGAREKGALPILGQVLVFAFFAFMFWFVESWAHHRTPYYVYSSTFFDLIPRCPMSWVGPGTSTTCTRCVERILATMPERQIPLCVLMMEASLTYSAMWTARLLGARLWVQPFMAGLMLVNVDLLLDPVVAKTRECITQGVTRSGVGVGLWQWFVDAQGQLDPGQAPLAVWFGVPLFNYAAWLAAPICLVALANLLGPFIRRLLMASFWPARATEPKPPAREGVLLLTVAGFIAFLFYMAPNQNLSETAQQALLAGGLLVVAGVVFWRLGRYSTDHSVDPALTWPTIAALTLPSLALLLDGYFVEEPLLIPVALAAVGFGLWLAWLPYRSALERFAEQVGDLDRFTRVHYFGFTVMLIALGAGLATGSPNALVVAGLLVVAVSFHVHAYVLNDVLDLDVDHKNPLRQRDPLVRGAITPQQALALAWVAPPLALLALLYVVSFEPRLRSAPFGALAAALALMLVYNRWGKRLATPPLTDLSQGLAWGALALVGAFSAGAPEELAGARLEHVYAVATYGALFILMINGIHGGLRDLVSDKAAGCRTTAMLLGATVDPGPPPRVQSSWRVIAFAFAIHSAMFATLFYALLRHGADFAYAQTVMLLLAILFIASSYLLYRVVERGAPQPQRNAYVSRHVFVALLPPLIVYSFAAELHPVFKIVALVCYFAPLLLQEWLLRRIITFAYRAPQPAPAQEPTRELELSAGPPVT